MFNYIHYAESIVEDVQCRVQNSCGALAITIIFILPPVSPRDPLPNISQVMIHHQEILVLCLAIDWMAVALRAPSLNKTSRNGLIFSSR